jgi:hypothetical protein
MLFFVLYMYHIQPYTYSQALKLGVKVAPSKNKSKKIDVLDWHGHFICSIGMYGYGDYPTYLVSRGEVFATERRRLYKLRQQRNRHKVGSAGYYADNLLW